MEGKMHLFPYSIRFKASKHAFSHRNTDSVVSIFSAVNEIIVRYQSQSLCQYVLTEQNDKTSWLL